MGRDRERVRVYLAHRIEARPGPVIGRDARQISLRQSGGGRIARGQRLAQLTDCCVLDAHGSLRTGTQCRHNQRQGGN